MSIDRIKQELGNAFGEYFSLVKAVKAVKAVEAVEAVEEVEEVEVVEEDAIKTEEVKEETIKEKGKIKFNYKCGCKGSKHSFNTEHTQKILEYAEENMCDDCKYTQFVEEKRKENEKALELSNSLELVKLEGTEKQVSWACTIRLKLIEQVKLADIKDESIRDMILGYIQKKETTAKFFIDNRDERFERLCKDIYLICKKSQKEVK